MGFGADPNSTPQSFNVRGYQITGNKRFIVNFGGEILDNEGNMYDLTHIAHQFNDAIGESSTDMEVMMTLMDDLNIRGATAFIHLVQNADEFSAAVQDLENSAGSAHTMAMIQQESLVNQIQIFT